MAAGMTPYQTHEKGYPDYLASQLNKVGALSSFNKHFAVSGYTTADILADIEANKAVPDGSGNTTDIQNAIANAEIITLDAGANDVLRQIEFDLEKMEANVDPVKVNGAITAAGLNTNTILAKIKHLNPNADVYVMGYYNPFPILPAQYVTSVSVDIKYIESHHPEYSACARGEIRSNSGCFCRTWICLFAKPNGYSSKSGRLFGDCQCLLENA